MSGRDQVLEFLSRVMTKTPWSKVEGSVLQLVINEYDRVAIELVQFINNGGRCVPLPVEPVVPLFEVVNATTIRVNLDHTGTLPFTDAKTAWTWGKSSGWVTVERKDEVLYIDGLPAAFYLCEEQKQGVIIGKNLKPKMQKKIGYHPNIGEALYLNPHLIPESYKIDEEGRTRYIFFWAKGFRARGGGGCVRCLCFEDGQWGWSYDWLVNDWPVQSPALVPASEPSAA